MVDSKSKKRLLVVTVVLLVAIGYMIYNSSASSLSYFKKIGEINADKTFVGKSVRVGGKVLPGTWVRDGRNHTFTIIDPDHKEQKLTVKYSGQLPSQFGEKSFVIADGTLASQDQLVAKSIVTQCPSKYKSEKKKLEGK